MIYLHPYTAGKPNISDSCFCVYCTRTAILLSRKGASMSFFFGIFYVNCNKTRTGNTAYRQSNNPYCYQQYTPGKSAFSDPIFLVFCQLCRTYISWYNDVANKMSALRLESSLNLCCLPCFCAICDKTRTKNEKSFFEPSFRLRRKCLKILFFSDILSIVSNIHFVV